MIIGRKLRRNRISYFQSILDNYSHRFRYGGYMNEFQKNDKGNNKTIYSNTSIGSRFIRI